MTYTSKDAIDDITRYFYSGETQENMTPEQRIIDWIDLKKTHFLPEHYAANYEINTHEIFYEKKKFRTNLTFEEVAKGIEKLLNKK